MTSDHLVSGNTHTVVVIEVTERAATTYVGDMQPTAETLTPRNLNRADAVWICDNGHPPRMGHTGCTAHSDIVVIMLLMQQCRVMSDWQ